MNDQLCWSVRQAELDHLCGIMAARRCRGRC